MHLPSSRAALLVAALIAALALGAGLGAVAFSTLDGGSTVVRQVTVTTAEPAASSRPTVADVYDRASKGVVEISASSGGGLGSPSSSAQGSGFVYDEQGHVVTNQHVVAGAETFRVSLWNGTEYEATVVGADPSTDLAVLKIDAPRAALKPLALANSSEVSVGDPVLALGSPFGLEGTLTQGIVSALHREMTAPNNFAIRDTIQTDAAINHGNSGGPLLDDLGRVIGVNAQIESESGGSDGVGFAIPSNTVKSIVTQLVATGTVEHAYLGIKMRAVADGVMVTEVLPDTPADRAGLKAATGSTTENGVDVPTGGDVVVAFDGTKVTTESDLQAAVDSRSPGESVAFVILRGGKTLTLEITLAERP
jgi:S1-C subfamily serine protease